MAANMPTNALMAPRPAPANPLLSDQADTALSAPAASAIYEPPRSTAGFDDRVSTRIPTAKNLGYDPHERSDLIVNHGAMHPGSTRDPKVQAALEKTYGNNAKLIQKYYGHINPGVTNEHSMQNFMDHAHDNIVWLWKQVRDKLWVPQAINWYKGANQLAKNMADQHGISHRQAAGVIAALSPRTDWDKNVEAANRTLTHLGNKDLRVTPEMLGRMQQYVDARKEGAERDALALQVHGGTDRADGGRIAPIELGQRISELGSPVQKALAIRAHDEMHTNNHGYDIISPTGQRSVAMNDDGTPSKFTWNGFDHIANAIRIAESKDHLPTISRALGGMHKVRNFYNNIIAPDHPDDITADTHAIGVGQLRPISGFHKMVGEGLGSEGSSSNQNGIHGLYGLYADAFRHAADTISRLEGRRLLPREVQSVTWEAVRNMFRDEHKKIDKTTFEPLHAVGRMARDAHFAHRYDFMPPDMAREAIMNAAGGIRNPSWWRG